MIIDNSKYYDTNIFCSIKCKELYDEFLEKKTILINKLYYEKRKRNI